MDKGVLNFELSDKDKELHKRIIEKYGKTMADMVREANEGESR